jgi:toxin YoeB
MRITFSQIGWEDYISWQNEDKKTLKKINALIKNIVTNQFL